MDDDTRNQLIEIVRDAGRKQFRKGDKLVLFDCIRTCAEYRLQLPRWALLELSKAFGRYLTGKNDDLNGAFFGARIRLGRHSNLATQRRENRDAQLLLDTVAALRRKGLKGDELYNQSRTVLRKIRVDQDNRLIVLETPKGSVPEFDTIKNAAKPLKTIEERASMISHLIPLFVDIDAA